MTELRSLAPVVPGPRPNLNVSRIGCGQEMPPEHPDWT